MVWPEAATRAVTTASVAADRAITGSLLRPSPDESSAPRLHPAPEEIDAVVVQELLILLGPAVNRHAHLPGSRKDLRILDRRLVVHHVAGFERRVALDHVQRIAVKVARHVEPRQVVEVRDVDD